MRMITPTIARRLAITAQRLARQRRRAQPPARPVQPPGYIYDLAHLDRLLWQDRSLFEYWAHAASIVLTEDYCVLPILHGDRLIGRIDPLLKRKQKRLMVNAVYVELDTPLNTETGKVVAGAIEELAAFLGAEAMAYGENVPKGWREALR